MTRIRIGKFRDADEKEVLESIFRKSGIECVTEVPVNRPDLQTKIDLLGICENVIVLVECIGKDPIGPKSRKADSDFRGIEPAFDKIMSDLPAGHRARELYENHKSRIDPTKMIFRRLLASFNRETKDSVKDHILKFCDSNKICLWTYEEMYYFRTLAECTYDHCQFEILEYLQVRPTEIKTENAEPSTPTYVAYGTRFEGLEILNFVVRVNTLLRRSSVKRLQDSSSKAGYQRLLDKEKLKRMRQYLLQDFPIYPNNIICKLHDDATVNNLFDMGASVELGPTLSARTSILRDMKDNLFLVELPDTHDAFEIIDGQHRLFSFSQAKYAQYEKCKDAAQREAFAEGDGKIKNLSKSANLVVTAIHSKNATVTKFSSPGRLFLDINTTQTRIKPEDVIDLVGKFYQNEPAAHANFLLTKLNTHGVLKGKIRVKFWQEDRIKRTSIIGYSGLTDIFDKDKKSYGIFHKAFERQTAITDYHDFCHVLINNYLRAMAEIVRAKHRKEYPEIETDLTLGRYYLFSAVFIGALIRLLRHFISDQDREFHVLKRLESAVAIDQDQEHTVNINTENEKIRSLFLSGIRPIAGRLRFTKREFDNKKGWGPNKWGKIEADLFYIIRRRKHPRFGDEKLISKKYRR